MRCVERDGVPEGRPVGRGGGGLAPGRGMTMGWVVAAPAGIPPEGNNPDNCGGVPPDVGPEGGGV
jgi:hypothetical protein